MFDTKHAVFPLSGVVRVSLGQAIEFPYDQTVSQTIPAQHCSVNLCELAKTAPATGVHARSASIIASAVAAQYVAGLTIFAGPG